MIGISVSLRQASLLSLHSLSYVTPSPPQTGSYSSPQLGHSQNAKSPLSTQIEWWLQDRLLQGPWESKKKMGTFDTKSIGGMYFVSCDRYFFSDYICESLQKIWVTYKMFVQTKEKITSVCITIFKQDVQFCSRGLLQVYK